MGRAQFAMEYLLVVGFSLAIIIPVTALLYGEYQESRTELHLEHLTEVARELAFQAEKVYYQGAPSSTTVEASFPPGVVRAEITHDAVYGVSTITFEMDSSDVSVYVDTNVPLQGSLLTFPGPHRISLTAEGTGVTITDRSGE